MGPHWARQHSWTNGWTHTDFFWALTRFHFFGSGLQAMSIEASLCDFDGPWSRRWWTRVWSRGTERPCVGIGRKPSLASYSTCAHYKLGSFISKTLRSSFTYKIYCVSPSQIKLLFQVEFFKTFQQFPYSSLSVCGFLLGHGGLRFLVGSCYIGRYLKLWACGYGMMEGKKK